MKNLDYRKLEAHYGVARALRKQIDELACLIRGLTYRCKTQNGGTLRISATMERRGGSFDRGCYASIPIFRIREAMLPALRAALAEARKEFADLA